MGWKTKYADKLRTAHDAAKLIESGEAVYLGMFGSCPEGLAKALYARHPELTDVSIYHYVAPFVWAAPETAGHFRLITCFTTPADRNQVHAGTADYQPIGNFRESYIKEILDLDAVMVKTSAPDAQGYMSFGASLWINRTACDMAPKIICEVDERLIRTYGENHIHISEVTALIEHQSVRRPRAADSTARRRGGRSGGGDLHARRERADTRRRHAADRAGRRDVGDGDVPR